MLVESRSDISTCDSAIAKVARLRARISLLCLVLALSDAIVLEQMELVDLQKLQRLCVVLCAMDLNGFFMI